MLKFLAGFDMVVHESVGRPESCGLLTANIPKRYCKVGTAGKPVSGVKTKVVAPAAGEKVRVAGEEQVRRSSVVLKLDVFKRKTSRLIYKMEISLLDSVVFSKRKPC